MILDIKENINKMDSELKALFENVYISEKSIKGDFFFSITANKMFLFEGCKKRIEVKVDINKNDLKGKTIKWKYSLNPLNENAETIERVSYLNNIANDIYDIASNKRMVNEYFSSLESHVDLITESVEAKENIIDILKSVIAKYPAPVLIEETKESIKLIGNLKMSEKFNLERELLATEKVEYVSFDENIIKIKLI